MTGQADIGMTINRRRGQLARVALLCITAICAGSLVAGGCGRPNQANIELRKQIQSLSEENQRLKQALSAAEAETQPLTVSGETGEVTLSKLFTTAGLRVGRLTGPAALGAASADVSRLVAAPQGSDGIKLHVVPVDAAGDELKAAGAWTIEAFDLSRPQQQRIATWRFALSESADHWYGQGLLYGYVLPLPWQGDAPESDEVLLRITFVEGLTGRTFSADRSVRLVR